VLDRCSEQGWLVIEAMAYEENKIAQYFYRSHGLTPQPWVHFQRRVDR
jgi:hypothetical protein